MKSFTALLILGTAVWITVIQAQDLPFPESAATDEAALSQAIPELARATLMSRAEISAADRFRLQLAAGQFVEAVAIFAAWRGEQPALAPGGFDPTIALELYAKAKAAEVRDGSTFTQSFGRTFAEVFTRFDARAALETAWFLETPLAVHERRLQQALSQRKGPTITFAQTMRLIDAYVTRDAVRALSPLLPAAFAADDAKRYVIDKGVLIKTKEGVTLSAIVVRKQGVTARQPASLGFDIYVNLPFNVRDAKLAALHGYVGVAADPRGKRLSPDPVEPWEHEARDLDAIIDWISKQPWSNGQVGMFGHSHGGFAAWAAAKSAHPALKTIMPMSASQPGLGQPMENNVFQLAQYPWPFYVMNNKTTDDAIYADRARWSALQSKWYASGRPFREIDVIDGLPNPLQRRQLQHPSFDEYYQAMQPYQRDYAKIDIPVLSLTGYYDGANPAAVNYLREHYRYNKKANHYLVVGPYEHTAVWRPTKPAAVQGYTIEPSAQFDTVALRFAWFDHVMRGGPRPALLKDRINYQVMGANLWRHAPSIERMSSETRTLYLTDMKVGDRYRLMNERPGKSSHLTQTIDFADRATMNNLYPMRAIEEQVEPGNGFAFISDPFDEPVSFDGQLSGKLMATINKKDMDFTLALYELMPDGRYFYLSYYLGRASYADDMGKRKLLTPGKPATIPFERTPLMGRQMSRGSRLLLLLTVNKNDHAQINYGTGKDVSDESIDDAKQPLQVRWHTDSYVQVPLRRSSPAGLTTAQ